MTCRIAGDGGPIVLETPLVRGGVGSPLRVGIRAGDILLAIAPPTGLSARNVIPGRIASLEQRDVIVSARVKCESRDGSSSHAGCARFPATGTGQRGVAGDQDAFLPLDAEVAAALTIFNAPRSTGTLLRTRTSD